ncbi:methyltransferase domain-containing protein [Nocardioides sp. dk4132]|uniref:class I SAM-dependent methyltransferase n=1 Tax=unclassified Nocardioides TaxID=2615069 RepID=UPI0012971045|nr:MULTISPECIES: class I SAM-dependent methyltransferase [unclassified Nocardioides]MQW77545.1 methyltransferase domain-containing protein [Nocardioides sp. dk4132]QGA06079.1 methyltransferase domain-containing protein [Nocardioides sp. dk884]
MSTATTTASQAFGENTYGDGLAKVYDFMYPSSPDAEAAGRHVASLAGPGGTALELGVGTGRVAAFTAAAGARVTGVDASQAMLEELHERHPDSGIETQLLDFTSQSTGRTFDVVYVPLSTFFVGRTQQTQLETMRLMREQVAEDGDVVIEAFEPRDYHAQQGARTDSHPFPDGSLMIDTTFVERTLQLIIVSHTTIGPGGRFETVKEIVRYAFAPELDLMAGLAGLELVERWSDWAGTPHTADSVRHVSRYRVRT